MNGSLTGFWRTWHAEEVIQPFEWDAVEQRNIYNMQGRLPWEPGLRPYNLLSLSQSEEGKLGIPFIHPSCELDNLKNK